MHTSMDGSKTSHMQRDDLKFGTKSFKKLGIPSRWW